MNYKIEILNDFSELIDVHKLVRKAYISSGILSETYIGNADFYPKLNMIPETKIIIARENGKIIGTNSITLDGKYGLHTDHSFKKETDLIRKTSKSILGSSWRIATSQEYHKKIGLFLDIIQKTFFIAKEQNIETCLFVFLKKHEKFYKSFLDAETIAEKEIYFEPDRSCDYVLMKTNTKKTQKHLSDIFINRKFS